MAGYAPGEQRAGTHLKLNTNENPYPPPPAALEAIRAACAGDALRRYPDPLARPVRDALGDALGVDPASVLVGNGSDEILTLLLRGFVDPPQPVVYPWPTYSLYPVLTEIQGGREVRVPWDGDWTLPAEGLANAAGRLTIVANPNSPSGTWTSPEALLDLAASIDGPLVVDEAYADFAGETMAGAVERCPNLVVVRTLSKSYALAGLRLGYLVAHPELVERLGRIKDSYNCDALSIAGGAAAIRATDWLADVVEKVVAGRERLSAGLAGLGFRVVPSRANFVLAHRYEAVRVFERLRDEGILVRYFDAPGLDDALRITVGTPEDNERLLEAIAAIVGDAGTPDARGTPTPEETT